nr:hypothetical protein JVH1_4135 [Rhodococcus sp. JVH1]
MDRVAGTITVDQHVHHLHLCQQCTAYHPCHDRRADGLDTGTLSPILRQSAGPQHAPHPAAPT